MNKQISKSIFHFSILIITWKNEKQKKIFFLIYFDLKPMLKNKNQNFQIQFWIWNSKFVLFLNQKTNYTFGTRIKCNHWILFYFLIVKLNFSICIKTISKHNIYFRLRVFFSTSSCRGLHKVFWIEEDIVSCFHFFDLFIQEQCIRCKWKKCVTLYHRKKLMKR